MSSTGCSGVFFGNAVISYSFSIVIADDDDGSEKILVSSIFSFPVVVAVVTGNIFVGDFYFFRAIWVHPSSSLLGWSPISILGLPPVGRIMTVVASVVVVAVVGGDDFGLVVFWGQDLEKWPNCLQFQHWGLLPSTTTIIIWSSYPYVWGIAWNPPLSEHMVIK